MALLSEWMQKCGKNVLDNAGIVRDACCRQLTDSALECTSMQVVTGSQVPGALPDVLRFWWISASPLGFLFAGRLLWEKTIWTWSRGPQMIGFALWHIHPGFAVDGTRCCLAVALWLLIALPYSVASPRHRALGLANDGRFGTGHSGFGCTRYILCIGSMTKWQGSLLGE
jgi:hypothetical protein